MGVVVEKTLGRPCESAKVLGAAGIGRNRGGVGVTVEVVSERRRTRGTNREGGGGRAWGGGAFAPSRRRRGWPEAAGRGSEGGGGAIAQGGAGVS